MATCLTCRKKFKARRSLEQHVAAKHDEPAEIPLAMPCLYCPRRFADLDAVNSHMKAKHGINYALSEEERQAKALRRYDHDRRAQLKTARNTQT